MTDNKSNKSRHYCFTINNYGTEELEKFHKMAKKLKKHKYICYGLEVGKEKQTPHIQGYIQLKQSQRFFFIQNYFDLKNEDGSLHTFHIEVAAGSADENRDYCKKEGDFYEYGEMVKTKGKRTDMEKLRKLIIDNPDQVKEIIKEHCTNLQQIKYIENLARYLLDHRDKDNPPTVIWISGATGIGKTRLVYETFEMCLCSN